MGSDALDFSIGLALSLEILNRYKTSGILQAPVARIPGMREQGLVRLHLVNGEVIACEALRQDGQTQPIRKEVLVQLDEERGPFEWILHVQPTPAPVPPPAFPPAAPRPSYGSAPLPAVQPSPRAYPEWSMLRPGPLRPLDVQQLGQWSSKDRMILRMVFSLVGEHRTIGEIKARLSLSSATVDDALHILEQLGFISLHS